MKNKKTLKPVFFISISNLLFIFKMDVGDLLKERLIFLKDLNIALQAKKKADHFLPGPLVSIQEIYIVTGGKAGYFPAKIVFIWIC